MVEEHKVRLKSPVTLLGRTIATALTLVCACVTMGAGAGDIWIVSDLVRCEEAAD